MNKKWLKRFVKHEDYTKMNGKEFIETLCCGYKLSDDIENIFGDFTKFSMDDFENVKKEILKLIDEL